MSTENALGDFSLAIAAIKSKFPVGKVVTFGGSYGGMLAAWMRMKHPELVDVAVASGAPLLDFDGVDGHGPDTRYYAFISELYTTRGSQRCHDNIRASLTMLMNSEEDLKTVMPHACNADKHLVYHELESPLISLPMKNYPFATNMMDKLPANPLNTACSLFEKPSLSALDNLLAFYGHECEMPEAKRNIILGWQALTCHEMVMPNLNGDGSLFPAAFGTHYDFAAKRAYC